MPVYCAEAIFHRPCLCGRRVLRGGSEAGVVCLHSSLKNSA